MTLQVIKKTCTLKQTKIVTSCLLRRVLSKRQEINAGRNVEKGNPSALLVER